MRRTVPLILLLIGFMWLIPGAVATDKEHNVTSITEDGYILNNAGTFSRDNTSAAIIAGYLNPNKIYRGYVEWGITGLPNMTITQVMIYYHGGSYVNDSRVVAITVHPTTTANNTLYWDIGNGTVYADPAGFPVVGTQQLVALNGSAVTSLQAALTAGQTWWAVGLLNEVEAAPPADSCSSIASEDGLAPNPVPTLWVEFLGNFTYVFDGGYYENGTLYGGVDVSYTTPTDNGEFTVNTTTTEQFAVEPTMFYWDIGGGYARYLYSFGSENFTVTIPEDTFYVYQFTIKDHTGKTGAGDCFLEAYRVINGTETLIERMKIYLGNPVPLNLVYGRTYHLRVLFADGSRYDWGYFMAGGVDSINLILKAVTFTDQAQILFNHIHVEATRNAAGNIITVNYLDERENTVWANVTISVRGGGIAYQAARNNDTYTLNWGGANTTLNYIVVVEGEHTDYGVWGRSFILDATHTYPDPPSLEDIFGEVNADFIPFTICMVSLLTFSVAMREKGLIATMFIASILKFINWASWGYDLLVFGWFISIGVALVARGGSN